MTHTTRPAVHNDLTQLTEMITALAAFHGDDAVRADINTLACDICGPNPWFTVIVAMAADSKLIGYAALTRTGQLQFCARGMDIHHLFVRDTMRRTGVGRSLVQASVEHAKAQGCKFITVGTHPENLKAGEFYTAIGFGRRPGNGPRFSQSFISRA